MNKFKILLVLTTIIALTIFSNGCEKEKINPCVQGTLSLTNTSTRSVTQQIIVNGENKGTLTPGEKKDIKLCPGVYVWELVGNDGTGCSTANVVIKSNETVSYSCGM